MGRSLDGGQVVELKLEEVQLSGGLGVGLLDLGNGLETAVLATGRDVDGGIALVEDVGELLADTAVAAGDDEDLALGVRRLLLS